MSETQRDPRTHAIIGAAMEVHRGLGHGFLEAVYHEALAIEFALRSIPFESEVRLRISYRDQKLRTQYTPDFICFGSIIVELKAVSGLDPAHLAQVINALKATENSVGVLLNFGAARLQWKRVVFSGMMPELWSEDAEA
jgi:GxxExxY protein